MATGQNCSAPPQWINMEGVMSAQGKQLRADKDISQACVVSVAGGYSQDGEEPQCDWAG